MPMFLLADDVFAIAPRPGSSSPVCVVSVLAIGSGRVQRRGSQGDWGRRASMLRWQASCLSGGRARVVEGGRTEAA
jgi:hypothetical protein